MGTRHRRRHGRGTTRLQPLCSGGSGILVWCCRFQATPECYTKIHHAIHLSNDSAELLQRVEQYVSLLDRLLVSCILRVWSIRLDDPVNLVDAAVQTTCRDEAGNVAEEIQSDSRQK